MMSVSNGPMSSAQCGATQPPKRKPPVGSSSAPPGACMTPSSEMNTAPVSLRIGGLAGGPLDRGDVDLLHRHHRLEDALGPRRVTVHRLGEDARGDLPRDAPLVLAPAAHAFLPAVADDRVPVAIGLCLALGDHHERERLALLEVRAAVE